MTRILVTGRGGQIAEELRRTLHPLGRLSVTGRAELDLADADKLRSGLRELSPDVIVNAAAYTAVDKAESEPELAMAVNAEAPGVLAEEAKRCGALLVHYSTEYVFDGGASQPYREDDPTGPLNVYGRSKLAGEEAIRASGADYLILRTSWVYGLRGRNFLRTMIRLAKEREELRVVDDQVGAPTWSRAIAEVTTVLLAQISLPGRDGVAAGLRRCDDVVGTYHLTAGGRTSWHGFTAAILEDGESLIDGQPPRLLPIASSDYSTAAQRPANSVLSNEKLQNVFGIHQLDWREALRLCLATADQT